jgi:hypothetical protein
VEFIRIYGSKEDEIWYRKEGFSHHVAAGQKVEVIAGKGVKFESV